jgi:hypothetical protein
MKHHEAKWDNPPSSRPKKVTCLQAVVKMNAFAASACTKAAFRLPCSQTHELFQDQTGVYQNHNPLS